MRSGPLPLVVEWPAGEAEWICPAPSLWSGTRERRDRLRTAGVGPGALVRVDGNAPGITWLQWWLACRTVGATLVSGDADDALAPLAWRVVGDAVPEAPADSSRRADLPEGTTWVLVAAGRRALVSESAVREAAAPEVLAACTGAVITWEPGAPPGHNLGLVVRGLLGADELHFPSAPALPGPSQGVK